MQNAFSFYFFSRRRHPSHVVSQPKEAGARWMRGDTVPDSNEKSGVDTRTAAAAAEAETETCALALGCVLFAAQEGGGGGR